MTRLGALLLAAAIAVQAGAFIANSSGTVDETVYLRQAESTYQRHDNTALATQGVAPLPIMLFYALPALARVPDYAQAILLARVTAVVSIAVPLVLIVFWWLSAETGPVAAFAGAAIVAFSPTVVAHSSIAATDACFVVCALLMLWALAGYIERPDWTRLALLVAAGALAFAAKYSAVALYGIVAIALFWMDRPRRALLARSGAAVGVAAAMLALGVIVTWRFHPLDGLASQFSHQRLGHEAYLFGRLSMTGWWYYQPVALALKSTYVELAALVITLVAIATIGRERSVAVRLWTMTAAVIVVMSMVSRVNIGVRYVLIVFPLAVMIATARLSRMPTRRLAGAIGVAAVAAQAWIGFVTAPRYLSYFNGIAGGPMNGYRALADSNLDWGQDLPAMRQILARVGAREALAAYFGSAVPDDYDVHVWQWHIAGPDVKKRCDWIVISATSLVGLYLPNDPFAPFRAIAPSARPTPSLFVYDASRPEVKAALAEAMTR